LLLPVSDWPIITIGPGGLLLLVSRLFAVSVLVLWVWSQKGKKHGCEIFFCWVTYWALLGMLLGLMLARTGQAKNEMKVNLHKLDVA
jgi:hypothetical protein